MVEGKIRIRADVQSASCEMLGIDSLEMTSEGEIITGVVKEKAEEVLETLKQTKEGKDA